MARYKGGYTEGRLERSNSGKIMQQARFDNNLSILEVAKKARVAESTLRKLEKSGVLQMRVDRLVRLARALKLNPLDLIEADLGYRYDEF